MFSPLSLPLCYVAHSIVKIQHLLDITTACNICMASMDSASIFLWLRNVLGKQQSGVSRSFVWSQFIKADCPSLLRPFSTSARKIILIYRVNWNSNFNLQAVNILSFSKKEGTTTIRSGQPQLLKLKLVENLEKRRGNMCKIKQGAWN